MGYEIGGLRCGTASEWMHIKLISYTIDCVPIQFDWHLPLVSVWQKRIIFERIEDFGGEMQLVQGGPNIPESLLQLHASGQVVFFCGAGISQPAGVPSFGRLVEELYKKNNVLPNETQRKAKKNKQYDCKHPLNTP